MGLWISFLAWVEWENWLGSLWFGLKLNYKFSDWTVPPVLLCGWSALSAILSAWTLLGYALSRYSHQAFRSGRAGSPVPCWIPQSGCTTMFALPIGRTPGWDYYLGAVSMNLVYQDLSTDCCKPLPTFSIKIRFPVVNLYRFPYRQHWLEDLKEVTHNAGELGCSLVHSLLPLEEPRRSGRTLGMVLWVGQCDQCAVASLTLLMQS